MVTPIGEEFVTSVEQAKKLILKSPEKVATAIKTKKIIDDEKDLFLEAFADVQKDKKETKESKETISNLPLAVAKQEKDAIKYFKINDEPENLKVVKHIQQLRKEGIITTKEGIITTIDLWGGRYTVTMPCDGGKMTFEFPADTKIADSEWEYKGFDWIKFTVQETTRGRLLSEEWQHYLAAQKKQGKTPPLRTKFNSLIDWLYPEWNEEEKILAFMLAVGFLGDMVLLDAEGKPTLAVFCSRESANRLFFKLNVDYNGCSLVQSTFIG